MSDKTPAPSFEPMTYAEHKWVRKLWDDTQQMVTLWRFMDKFQNQAKKP